MIAAIVGVVVMLAAAIGMGVKEESFKNDSTVRDTVEFEKVATVKALEDVERLESAHPEWEEQERREQEQMTEPDPRTEPGI